VASVVAWVHRVATRFFLFLLLPLFVSGLGRQLSAWSAPRGASPLSRHLLHAGSHTAFLPFPSLLSDSYTLTTVFHTCDSIQHALRNDFALAFQPSRSVGLPEHRFHHQPFRPRQSTVSWT